MSADPVVAALEGLLIRLRREALTVQAVDADAYRGLQLAIAIVESHRDKAVARE